MKFRFIYLVFLLTFTTQSIMAQNKTGWAGHYVYEEEPVKAIAGYAQVMQWDLTIAKKQTITAIIEVSGQQTFFKLLADVTIAGNSATLTYNKTLDGVDYGAFKKGQQLLILKNNDAGKLITKWAVLTPQLSGKYPKECACFIKK